MVQIFSRTLQRAQTIMATDWIESCDPTQIRNEVLPRLEKDIAGFEAGLVPSNLCISIPKLHHRGGKIHAIIAEMLFSEHVEDQINELRQKLESKRAKKERIEIENNGNLKSVEIDDDRREESNEKTGKTGERVKSEDNTMKSRDLEAVITDDDLMTRLKARWNSRLDVLLTKMRNSITKARDERRKFAEGS